MQQVRCWRPRPLATAQVQALGWSVQAPWQSLSAEGWHLAACPDGNPEAGGTWFALELEWGQRIYRLTLPEDLLRRLCERSGHPVEPQGLASDWLSLLVEAGSWPLLEQLATLTGANWQCLACRAANRPDRNWFQVRREGRRWPISLDGDEDDLQALFKHWPVQAAQGIEQLRFAVTIRLGLTRLERGLVASLQRGDVVLLQYRSRTGQALLVAGARYAHVHKQATGWELVTALSASITEFENILDLPMAPDNPSAIEDIDALQVTLTFEVGQRRMTLAELRALAPGKVLGVPEHAPGRVDIVANGSRIGHGELVEIDGRAGIRIEAIFQHGVPAGASFEASSSAAEEAL